MKTHTHTRSHGPPTAHEALRNPAPPSDVISSSPSVPPRQLASQPANLFPQVSAPPPVLSKATTPPTPSPSPFPPCFSVPLPKHTGQKSFSLVCCHLHLKWGSSTRQGCPSVSLPVASPAFGERKHHKSQHIAFPLGGGSPGATSLGFSLPPLPPTTVLVQVPSTLISATSTLLNQALALPSPPPIHTPPSGRKGHPKIPVQPVTLCRASSLQGVADKAKCPRP